MLIVKLAHPFQIEMLATPAMHPDPAWRVGYNDGIMGMSKRTSSHYEDNLLYFDGFNCGSVKRNELLSGKRRLDISWDGE